MVYIRKRMEPKKLQTYRQQPNATFDSMDADVKTQLRNSLLAEQGHLCAYCMCRIHDERDVKIEHWTPRNSGNEMDYNNLLAVCYGNEGFPKNRQTCDTRKGSNVISINPLKESDMQRIFYSNSGEIHSTDVIADQDIRDKLNLNDRNGQPFMGRQTALKAFKCKLHKYKDPRNTKAFLKKMQDKYEPYSEMMTPYIGVLRWYIDKKLQKFSPEKDS